MLKCRILAGLVALVVSMPGGLCGQPASPAVAGRQLLEAVERKLQAGDPVERALYQRMLAANTIHGSLAETHRAQALYAHGVLIPRLTVSPVRTPQDAAELAAELASDAASLRGLRVSEELIAAQQIYLALYERNLPDKGRFRATLDRLSEPMTSERVAPHMRGDYWNLRGLTASEDGNYALALECHERALALRRQLQSPFDEAQSLCNFGFLLLRLGDHAAAQGVLTESCRIYAAMREAANPQESKDQFVSEDELLARLNLAKAREAALDFFAARETYQDLLVASQKYPKQLREVYECLFRNNLAIALYGLGEFQACERELLTAHGLALRHFGETDLRVAEIDVNLGWVALATGRKELAERKFEHAVNNLRVHHRGHARYAEALGYLARAKAALDKPVQALAAIKEAVDLREQEIDRTLASALSRRDRLAYIQQLRVHPDSPSWPGALDTYLELASELEIPAAEQYDRVLKWKGALSRYQAAPGSDQGHEERRLIEAERALIRMRLLALAPAARRQEPAALQEVGLLEQEANAVERRLRAAIGAGLKPRPPVSLTDVVAAIPADTVLLDLLEARRYQPRSEGDRVRNDRVYLGFVVTALGEVQRVGPFSSARIDPRVTQFRQRVEGVDKSSFQIPARQLHESLGGELRASFGEASNVIISADGALQHLPWAAMPGLKSRYWIEELTLTFVPTAFDLVARQAEPQKSQARGWLAVGGVEYGADSAGNNKWEPLAGTLREAEQVHQRLSRVFPSSDPLVTLITGRDASKARVQSLLGQRRIVHLATHGEFQSRKADGFGVLDGLAGLDSVLVFAGANSDATGGADSLLTADEVAAANLSAVELIVLSACQTGLGHVQSGQGQVGLVAALNTAGAKAVVASLWRVSDEATARLMDGFYQHALAQPASISSALRRAQLDMLSSDDMREPANWAAWTVTGGPDEKLRKFQLPSNSQ